MMQNNYLFGAAHGMYLERRRAHHSSLYCGLRSGGGSVFREEVSVRSMCALFQVADQYVRRLVGRRTSVTGFRLPAWLTNLPKATHGLGGGANNTEKLTLRLAEARWPWQQRAAPHFVSD